MIVCSDNILPPIAAVGSIAVVVHAMHTSGCVQYEVEIVLSNDSKVVASTVADHGKCKIPIDPYSALQAAS